jgi:hypothetical protein
LDDRAAAARGYDEGKHRGLQGAPETSRVSDVEHAFSPRLKQPNLSSAMISQRFALC